MSRLCLDTIRRANVSRLARWHGEVDWSLADWSNAMCGEAGEAANVVKKLRRLETGLADQQLYAGDSGHVMEREALLAKLADEIADVLLYLDLLAHAAGVDLAWATAAKFNRVSEAQGFPERILLMGPSA